MGQGKSLCSDGAYWPKLIGQNMTMIANSSHACDCRRSLGRCAEMKSNWGRMFRGLTKVLAPCTRTEDQASNAGVVASMLGANQCGVLSEG
jgi:hypothetical protein